MSGINMSDIMMEGLVEVLSTQEGQWLDEGNGRKWVADGKGNVTCTIPVAQLIEQLGIRFTDY